MFEAALPISTLSGRLEGANPFPGLSPFDEKNAKLFFGRTNQQDELITRLTNNRFLAVIGVSGSGKSSLVRAGLLPPIRNGYLDSWTDWRIAVLRPGDQPVAALAGALVEPFNNAGFAAEDLERHLRSGGKKALLNLAYDHLDQECRLLIFVDQFEELFRFKDDRVPNRRRAVDDAADFAQLLLLALDHPQIYVVITMRSDYLGDCAQFEGLPEQINKGQYLIPRLTREEQMEIVQRPVWAGKSDISDDLVERLIRDVGSEPQQLPILQHLLMRIWRHWEVSGSDRDAHRPIGRTDYDEVGGFQGALNKHADEIYRELGSKEHNGSREQQWIAQRVFRRITIKDRSGRVTRRPATLKDIYEITDAADDSRQEMVGAVIARYQRDDCNFLAPFDERVKDDGRMVDITHESLCDLWQELTTWVDDEAEAADRYRMISEQADLFEKKGRGPCDPSELIYVLDKYRPLERSDRDGWTKAWSKRYNHPEKDVDEYDRVLNYLEMSQSHLAAEDAKRKESLAREANLKIETAKRETERKLNERNLRDARRNKWFAGSLALLALGLVIACIYILKLRSSELVSDLIEKAAAEAEQNPNVALAYVSGALSRAPNSLAARTLLNSLVRYGYLSLEIFTHRTPVRSARFGDNDTVITTADDQPAQLWDLKTGKPLLGARPTIEGVTTSLDVSASGLLVTASLDRPRRAGVVKLYDIRTNEVRGELPPRSQVNIVRFSPDGRLIATADESVQVWNVADLAAGRHAEPPRLPQQHVWDLAFGADGKLATVSTGETSVFVWDFVNGKKIREFQASAQITSIAFSPDGNRVAIGTDSSGVDLWELTGSAPQKLFIPTSDTTPQEPAPRIPPISKVEFSMDSKRLAAGNQAGAVAVWDLNDGKPVASYKGHREAVLQIRFSQSGQYLVTASADDSARIWEVGTGKQIGPPLSNAGDVYDASFSPNEKYVLTASGDGMARLWRVPQSDADHMNQTVNPRSVDVSSDEKRILSASGRGGIDIWDTNNTKRPIRTLGVQANRARFSLDGKNAASASNDGTVTFWNTEGWSPVASPLRACSPGTPPGPAGALSVAFSADSKEALVSCSDGSAYIWNVSTRQPVQQAFHHSGAIFDAEFSFDGRSVVTASFDGTAMIWDVATARQKKNTLKPRITLQNGGIVRAATFSHNSKLVLTASDNRTAKVWDATTGTITATLSSQAPVRSALFNKDDTLIVTAAQDGAAQVWDAATGKPLGSPMRQTAALSWAAVSADNRWVTTFDDEGASYRWSIQLNSLPNLPTLAAWLGFGSQSQFLEVIKTASGWSLNDKNVPVPFNLQDETERQAGYRNQPEAKKSELVKRLFPPEDKISTSR